MSFLSFAGDLFSSALGFLGQEKTNNENAYQAQINRDFQRELAGNAHQREVADLQAAGLNPILSATRGGSAVPSGNVAIMQNPMASAFEGWRSSSENRARNTSNRSTEQNMNIKRPVETLAGDADKGVEYIKAGVEAGVKAALESVRPATEAVNKVAESIGRGSDAVASAFHDVGQVPSKLLDKVVSSAAGAAQSGRTVANATTIGGPLNWSKDHLKNLRDIRAIPDEKTRGEALFLYNAWRRKYGK